MTILISSAGRRVELIQCFRQSAAELNTPLRVIAADTHPLLSAACALADARYEVPGCSNEKFVPALLEICSREKVSLLIPTIDPELEALALTREKFAAAGTLLAISSPAVIAMARDKERTAKSLAQNAIPTAATLPLEELCRAPAALRYPVLIKPRSGSASAGITLLTSPEELPNLPRVNSARVAQEHLSGREFTVNLFFDYDALRCAIPHERLQVRGGEVSKAVTRREPALLEIAKIIGHVLSTEALGALCFQAILDERSGASVFELNARFGGGYPLAHRAGATFTKWLLELALGVPCSAHGNWKENILMLRYDSSVFYEAPVDATSRGLLKGSS